MVQWRHAVEEVRDHGGAGVGRCSRAVVVDGRVPERDDDAALDERFGGAKAQIGFGRERDETHEVAVTIAERQQPFEIDGSEEVDRMCSGSATEERALEMDAEHDVGS